jgi:3-oxoacyl-[acyl-carrier-protein] synthase-1
VTGGHSITGVAIANCLGTDNRAVFEGAFAGVEAFSPGPAFHAFPFTTELGIMPAVSSTDALACPGTRQAVVAFASVRQLRAQVRAAVERWGAGRVAYVFASRWRPEETERARASAGPTALGVPTKPRIDATSGAIARDLERGRERDLDRMFVESALESAIRLIDRGIADAAVVGSADSLCRTTVFGFHSLGLAAPTATRPFARDRAGITLGEGSAYILIERTTKVTAPHSLAVISGTGAASEAFHHTSPHPEGLGGQLCMRRALDRAGVTPNEIDFVSAHGTGTRQNDAAEAAALTRVFERRVPITATKSLTGHTLGSAGLTSLVLVVEALRRQAIPPTLRSTPVDDGLGVAIVDRSTPIRARHALINAFGFGGSNASVVVSQPRAGS